METMPVETEIENKRLYNIIRKILPVGTQSLVIYGFSDLDFDVSKEVSFNGENFLIFPVKHLIPRHNNVWYWHGEDEVMFKKEYTHWNIIFDLNIVQSHSWIDIRVPKGKKGLFIGKGSWQVRELSRILGNKHISFVEQS